MNTSTSSVPPTDGDVHRILHVAQPTEAGVAVVVEQLVRHQLRAGWSVAVACPHAGRLPAQVGLAGATVLPWAANRSPAYGVPSEVASLTRLIASCNPDLVHLHSSKAGLIGRLAIRGRRRTIYQPHAWSFLAATGTLRSASVGWERAAARWCDGIACVSPTEKQIGLDAGVHATWFSCPNGIDLERFRPPRPVDRAATLARLGLDGKTVVVCVGRLCEQKGQDVLLRAWASIERPDVALVLVGDGPARVELERNAGDGVVFTGDTDDVAMWYSAASLMVQPSRWEGASLSTREAMACGLSIVTTDVAGAREAVGDAGAVVAGEDPAALAFAVTARLDDPILRAAEGRRARQRAETHFGLASSLALADDMYATVLTAGGPTRARAR